MTVSPGIEAPRFRADPSATRGSFADSVLVVLIASLGVGLLPVIQSTAVAADTRTLDFEPEKQGRHIKENHTFHLKRSFRFPAGDTLVQFLFEKLEVNTAMVRAWDLLNLHATKKDTRTYYARVGNQMEGPTYRLAVAPGTVRYVGKGIYRQDYLPFPIEGSALMELDWKPIQDTEAVQMTANLRLRPTSEVLHLIGTLLHPVAKSALDDALREVINLGRTLVHKIRNHPEETHKKLRNLDESYGQRWRNHLEINSSFANVSGPNQNKK